MDLPTAWNVNDKSNYLSVNSDELRVSYTVKNINIGMLYNY